MAKQPRLDWKSLLNQKPEPSSVTKRSYNYGSSQAPTTPGTPAGSSSSKEAGVHDEHRSLAAIPFLLLPVAIPEVKCNRLPIDKPAEELLSRLAELKRKAASLVGAGASQKPPGTATAKLLDRAQILPDPLPPPGHVYEADSCLWHNSDDQEDSSKSSTEYEVPGSSRAGVHAAAGHMPGLHSSSMKQGMSAVGPRAAVSQGDRMATSLTDQTAGTSLITTANSPGLQVQQALARIRQLQHRTEEAFHQGDLFREQLEEQEHQLCSSHVE